MRVKKLIVIAVPVFVLLAALILAWASRRDLVVFNGTTAITFTERGDNGGEMSITITDQNEVQRLLGTIRLRRKKPCSCSHVHKVTFEKAAERVEVSFCDHCFAVLGPKQDGWYPKVRDYWMPKEFYSEFRKLTLSRTNESWSLRP